MDVAGRVLLRVIEMSPETVELALLATALEQQAFDQQALARSMIKAAEQAIKAAEHTLAKA